MVDFLWNLSKSSFSLLGKKERMFPLFCFPFVVFRGVALNFLKTIFDTMKLILCAEVSQALILQGFSGIEKARWFWSNHRAYVVGVRWLEHPTSWSRTKRSTKLSHTPKYEIMFMKKTEEREPSAHLSPVAWSPRSLGAALLPTLPALRGIAARKRSLIVFTCSQTEPHPEIWWEIWCGKGGRTPTDPRYLVIIAQPFGFVKSIRLNFHGKAVNFILHISPCEVFP